MLIALHKPYDMLSQFTPDHAGQQTLAACGFGAGVYPIGRLDRDSEGLLLLSDEAVWTDRLLNPRRVHRMQQKIGRDSDGDGTGDTEENLATLEQGVVIQGHRTQPAIARHLDPAPPWPPRTPPIRVRKTIPDAWISLQLTEGKNRQVRRMTAAVGLPTLRLIRARIGQLELATLMLQPGQWRALDPQEIRAATA